MASITRFSPMYWNGKKLAFVQKGNYKINANVTQELGADGFMGNSLGAILTSASIEGLCTKQGNTTKLRAQETGKLGIVADGELHQFEATVGEIEYDTESEKGRSTIKVSFTGGAPQIT
jgi:hypothetical protein